MFFAESRQTKRRKLLLRKRCAHAGRIECSRIFSLSFSLSLFFSLPLMWENYSGQRVILSASSRHLSSKIMCLALICSHSQLGELWYNNTRFKPCLELTWSDQQEKGLPYSYFCYYHQPDFILSTANHSGRKKYNFLKSFLFFYRNP